MIFEQVDVVPSIVAWIFSEKIESNADSQLQSVGQSIGNSFDFSAIPG